MVTAGTTGDIAAGHANAALLVVTGAMNGDTTAENVPVNGQGTNNAALAIAGDAALTIAGDAALMNVCKSPTQTAVLMPSQQPRCVCVANCSTDHAVSLQAPPMIVEEVDVDLAAGLTEDEVNMMRAMGMPVVGFLALRASLLC